LALASFEYLWQLEEDQMSWEKMEFEALLEAVPDALLGVDEAGVIRFVNRQTESMFGYEHGDLVGKPLETLVPVPLRADHAAHRREFTAAPGSGGWAPG